jgi:hypothetical protein
LASNDGSGEDIPLGAIERIDLSDTGGPVINSGGGHSLMGVHALQVRNPNAIPRTNEVVRFTLNLPDGELMDPANFRVNDTGAGQEVLSGSLASTVVTYASNFVKKMDIVFQDDFAALETKSYEINTGQPPGLSSDLTYNMVSPYIYVYDSPREYQIQTSNDLSHFTDGVFVNYLNGSFTSSSRILVRLGGNQLMLDQGIISLAWGNPTSVSIDSNSVMVSVHLIYDSPYMVTWGPSWSTINEIVKDVDFMSANVTINIYNHRELIESIVEKKFKEKFYNHNGVVMEFSAMYDGDGDYLAIMGNSQHTTKLISSRILTWERIDTAYAGIDEGNFSVPSFADLNGDGMKDMIIGMENGTLSTYLNTGTPVNPIWTYNGSIYSGIDVGSRSAPAVYDLDGDGDKDTVVGNETGHLQYFINTGGPVTPSWTYEPSMYAGIKVNNCSKPEFADIDDDGDLDMIVGMGNGNVSFYQNTGDSSVPVWTYDMTHFLHLNEGATRIPTSFVNTTTRFSSPTFADVDSDGDLDFSSGFMWSYYNLLSHFENTGNATDPVYTRLRPDLFATVRGSGFDKFHSVPRFVDMNGDSLLDIIFGGADGKLTYFENRGLMGRSNMPIYNMQPLENGTYRFYIDQDSNDGPYSIVNYSADFNDYYVLAKPSSGKAILRYIPGFAEQVYRDRYNGDRYLWAGGNVSYYPFIPEEDGYVTRGILIARGFSGSGTSKGISGGTFLSQTGTAGGFQQVAMTSMSHESRMVLLTELAYNADHTVYDDLVDLLKTPLEIIVSPDLFIEEKGIEFTPGVAGEGELVTINATVHNIGGQVANGVDVDFYHGTLNPPDKFATSTIMSIGPGEKGYAEATWDSTGNTSTNIFYAVVDPLDSITELDETNNNASRNLEVTDWRLVREMFQVTSDTNTSMDPTVAVDSSGRVWFAYHTYTHNDDFEVFTRTFDNLWSPEELIGADAKRTSRPFIASRGSDVWLTYTSNSVEVDMYNSTRQGWYYWAMKFDLYTHRFDGVDWQPGERLTQSVIQNESDQIPSAVIDDSGNLWLGYRHTPFYIYAVPGEQIANIPYQDMNIYGAMYNGSWTVPFDISTEMWSEGWYGGPTMGLDGAGQVWAIYAWERFNNWWDIYGRFWNGSTWSAPQQLTTDFNMDIRPSTVRDTFGNLWVVWESNRDGNKEIYAKFYNGTAWSPDTRLTFDSGHDIKPYITSDILGNVWVVWENDRDGNKNIYLKRFNGTAWSPDIPLTTDQRSDECPFIVSDPTTGDLWVAWETDRNGHGNKDIYTMRLYILSGLRTNLEVGDPKHVFRNIYIKSTTPLSLSVDDIEGVGVASTWFRTWNSTDGWTQWIEYTGQFSISGADGTYFIEYNSTDMIGGVESTKNATVILDNTEPQTSLSIGQPSYVGITTYITSATEITLNPSDAGSGVNYTFFRIWESSSGWSSWIQYTAPFTISGPDGPRYIECYSVDNLSNVEPVKNCTSSSGLYLATSPMWSP